MSLKALQGFVRIVELDSFSEAAEALFLSQSALSQQIRVLEAQLKVQLFQHAQRRVVLTPAIIRGCSKLCAGSGTECKPAQTASADRASEYAAADAGI